MTIASSWAVFSGKNELNIDAPEEETQLCPEGYDGWFGFPTPAVVVIARSAFHGRTNQYVSFASQQPMVASSIAALVSAYMCVTCRSDMSCCTTQPESVGTLSQNPA